MVVAEITPIPEEQELIQALSAEFMPLHRADLPYHNFSHSHDDVLPEALALDARCRPEGNPHSRRLLIAAALGHEALWHVPLDPKEGFSSKEERAAHLIGTKLPAHGYATYEVEEVRSLIRATEPGIGCTTENEIKIRRGDIKNVASKRQAPFLATTVKLFYETLQLCKEAGDDPPYWSSYISRQQKILRMLLKDDLSLSFEPRLGSFNRAAERNVEALSNENISEPHLFIRRYGYVLKRVVPMLHESDLRG